MSLSESILATIVGGWIFSLIIGDTYTVTKMFAVVLGISIYWFIKPLVTVMYKNYRKEIYRVNELRSRGTR